MQRASLKAARALDLPIGSIFADDFKLRPVDEERVQELMLSFASKGQQQPIKVRPNSNGSYVVVFGEHRLEAAKRLGWKEISALVEKLSDLDALELKVTENVLRNHYNSPYEEGKAYQLLLSQKYRGNLNALSESVGKPTSHINERLTVFHNLDRSLLQYLGKEITTANAIAIAKYQDHRRQLEVAQAVIRTRTSYASTAWSSGGGAGEKLSMGQVRVKPLHACTCGCGDIHPIRNAQIKVDVGEPGVGAKVVLGTSRSSHLDVRSAGYVHVENPRQEGYSFCGYPLTQKWNAELPRKVDTRTFQTGDGDCLCDHCARAWRKA